MLESEPTRGSQLKTQMKNRRGASPASPESKKLSVGIIGVGRLGLALGRTLRKLGHPITVAIARTEKSARRAARLLAATGVSPDTRAKDLTEPDIAKLREYIDKNLRVEGDLQREVAGNIRRLKEINSYRGLRHKANLPAHGQRTKTNARTKRGRKVTMGSGRKKSASKT